MKRKIIAIGGGRLRTATPQTTTIDREIVSLSGKARPRLLFIPTASLDPQDYCDAVARQFGGRLGCRVDSLLLYRAPPSRGETREKILAADIIYVGGGNTLRMMRLWRRLGIDRLLDRARRQGTVLSGLSAGAICWFRQGNSDSRKFADARNKTLIKVAGLDFVDLLLCPHYDSEPHRQPALRKMMSKTAGVALALEDCCAIEIVDDHYRIIVSRPGKRAYRLYRQQSRRGHVIREPLPPHKDFRPIAALIEPA